MFPATPLPPELLDRPFRVAEALALGVTRKRLRSADLRAPFYGVRVRRALGWDPVVRARCGLLVAPPGTAVVGFDAVAVAGLPLPYPEEELLGHLLSVAVPPLWDLPQTAGLRAVPLVRGTPLVVTEGVVRLPDADAWAAVAGQLVPTVAHRYAVALGRAVLDRCQGRPDLLEEAVGRLGQIRRLRAGRVLDDVLQRGGRRRAGRVAR